MIVDAHGHYHSKEGFVKNAKKAADADEWARRIYEAVIQRPDAAEEATSAKAWIRDLDRFGVDKILLQVAPFYGYDAVAEFIKEALDRFVYDCHRSVIGQEVTEQLDIIPEKVLQSAR